MAFSYFRRKEYECGFEIEGFEIEGISEDLKRSKGTEMMEGSRISWVGTIYRTIVVACG